LRRDEPILLGEILDEVLRQMDPERCLARAEEALANNDVRNAKESLEDYVAWRGRGGFEPPGGDARAKALLKEFSKRLKGRSRTNEL
jgi:hypothetical protein